MCLTVDKEKFKIEKAQEDIVVYKVLEKHNGMLLSALRGFVYEIGKEYKTIMEPRCKGPYYQINEGFHSFLTLKDAENEQRRTLQWDEYRCFRCMIPKGSKIVYGKYAKKDAIVSEAIKIVEEV